MVKGLPLARASIKKSDTLAFVKSLHSCASYWMAGTLRARRTVVGASTRAIVA